MKRGEKKNEWHLYLPATVVLDSNAVTDCGIACFIIVALYVPEKFKILERAILSEWVRVCVCTCACEFTWWALQMRSRSCRLRNLLTTSAPNVKETPRSFSPQPWTSLSGSDHSRSHSNPGTHTHRSTYIKYNVKRISHRHTPPQEHPNNPFTGSEERGQAK